MFVLLRTKHMQKRSQRWKGCAI